MKILFIYCIVAIIGTLISIIYYWNKNKNHTGKHFVKSIIKKYWADATLKQWTRNPYIWLTCLVVFFVGCFLLFPIEVVAVIINLVRRFKRKPVEDAPKPNIWDKQPDADAPKGSSETKKPWTGLVEDPIKSLSITEINALIDAIDDSGNYSQSRGTEAGFYIFRKLVRYVDDNRVSLIAIHQFPVSYNIGQCVKALLKIEIGNRTKSAVGAYNIPENPIEKLEIREITELMNVIDEMGNYDESKGSLRGFNTFNRLLMWLKFYDKNLYTAQPGQMSLGQWTKILLQQELEKRQAVKTKQEQSPITETPKRDSIKLTLHNTTAEQQRPRFLNAWEVFDKEEYKYELAEGIEITITDDFGTVHPAAIYNAWLNSIEADEKIYIKGLIYHKGDVNKDLIYGSNWSHEAGPAKQIINVGDHQTIDVDGPIEIPEFKHILTRNSFFELGMHAGEIIEIELIKN